MSNRIFWRVECYSATALLLALFMALFTRSFVPIILACLCTSAAHAVTLDWDGVTWTAGSLSNPYDIDPLRAGNDVTVTISGNTPQLQPEIVAPNPMTPALTTNFQGGLGTAQNTLSLAVNFTDQTQFITVTVDFSAQYTLGVQNVSFTVFDVDFDNVAGSTYRDQLRNIVATSVDGTTLIPAIITTSGSNSRTGSGLGQVVDGIASVSDTGPTSGDGNVIISFGTTAIRSFTFTYGSGSATAADPTYQHIGIHDITFTPVPEMNPTWTAVGSCLLAAALILRHSGKFRK